MTSGEVARTLAGLSSQLDRLRSDLQPVITRDAADFERFRVMERRLDSLESWQTWVTRLILAAVIVGVLSLAWVNG